jgi:hypothetical protein
VLNLETSSPEREVGCFLEASNSDMTDRTLVCFVIVADEVSTISTLSKQFSSTIRTKIEVLVDYYLSLDITFVGSFSDSLVLSHLKRPNELELPLSDRIDRNAEIFTASGTCRQNSKSLFTYWSEIHR